MILSNGVPTTDLRPALFASLVVFLGSGYSDASWSFGLNPHSSRIAAAHRIRRAFRFFSCANFPFRFFALLRAIRWLLPWRSCGDLVGRSGDPCQPAVEWSCSTLVLIHTLRRTSCFLVSELLPSTCSRCGSWSSGVPIFCSE